MSSVFDQAFSLSQAIVEHAIGTSVHALGSVHSPGVDAYCLEPFQLLNSLGVLFPHQAELIVFDTPRSSKRKAVKLYATDNSGSITLKDIDYADPSYRFIHAANLLAHARLLNRVLANDGILLAITTPDIYLNVRGALEHYLGVDKYIGELVYQSRSGGGSDSRWLSTDHETLLIFAKDKSLISRFQLDKEEEELQRYKLEDSESKYVWDTFIRKNARNFYKIKAPDGTVLDVDENGNPIPWLWSKKTFEEKLRKGDIKFEKNKDDKWRLYYKDRLKDVKILRSISLNATLLREISDDFPGEQNGGDLLNAKGSLEIKKFTGYKPDYLKPSDFFHFLFTVFNKNGGLTIVPFNDYGAAAEGAAKHGKFKEKLIINNENEFMPLLEWRRVNIESAEFSLSQVQAHAYTLDDFYRKEDAINLVQQLIAATAGINEEWSLLEIEDESFYLAKANDVTHLYIPPITIDALTRASTAIMDQVTQERGRLTIYSEYEPDLIGKIFGGIDLDARVTARRIPDLFLR